MLQAARTLVIETATEACSVALFERGELIAHDHREVGRGHAEMLVPMIAALPDKGRSERILVSLGPGSFTGVRIGIAAARALGVAWQAQVLGYPTLALVAVRAWQPTLRAVTVCMNGGHGEWFVQNFQHDKALGALNSLTPHAASTSDVQQVIVGNRAAQLAELVGDNRLAIDIGPDARKVGLLHEASLVPTLTPIYGRAPDAKPQPGYKAPSIA